MHKLGSGPLTSLEVRCRLFCSINLKKNDVENKSGSSRRNSEQEEAELQSGSKLPGGGGLQPSPQAVYLMPGWGGHATLPGPKRNPCFICFSENVTASTDRHKTRLRLWNLRCAWTRAGALKQDSRTGPAQSPVPGLGYTLHLPACLHVWHESGQLPWTGRPQASQHRFLV